MFIKAYSLNSSLREGRTSVHLIAIQLLFRKGRHQNPVRHKKNMTVRFTEMRLQWVFFLIRMIFRQKSQSYCIFCISSSSTLWRFSFFFSGSTFSLFEAGWPEVPSSSSSPAAISFTVEDNIVKNHKKQWNALSKTT